MTKSRKKPIDLLRPEEVQALIDAGSRRAPTGIRNRALIAVMYYSGLRVSEALALSPADLDMASGSINVLDGKGHRARIVALHGVAQAHLDRWMDKRKRLGITKRRPLFCTLEGKAVSRVYVGAMLRRYATRAGIAKRVHPHGLRHSHAAHLVEEGVAMHLIQQQLGHANLAITGQYLDSIAPLDRVNSIRSIAW